MRGRAARLVPWHRIGDARERMLRYLAETAKHSVYQGSRRAQGTQQSERVTASDWLRICAAWGYCCAYCGRVPECVSGDHLEPDHVEPIARGGLHTTTNLVPACTACNSRKADLLLLEWVLVQQGIWKRSGRGARRSLRLSSETATRSPTKKRGNRG